MNRTVNKTPRFCMLRVGIDLGCGGSLAPVNERGEFEFIPIPEEPGRIKGDPAAKGIPRYTALKNRYSCFRPLAEYVPKKRREYFCHLDPDFEGFTYGDPTPIKSAALRRLEPDDYLIFYAGLRMDGGRPYKDALYLIGYFEVEGVYTGKGIIENRDLLSTNAHSKCDPREVGLVIVKGGQGSRLFQKAIRITDFGSPYPILGEFEGLSGYRKNLTRSPPRWLKPLSSSEFTDWLVGKPEVESGNTLD